MVHLQMSIHLKAPELELEQREAKMLAQAGANVARWYAPLDMDRDTRSAAWIALFVAMFIVYGPRILAITKRYREDAAYQAGAADAARAETPVMQ